MHRLVWAGLLLAGIAVPGLAVMAGTESFVVVPAERETDLRYFGIAGERLTGSIALERMSKDAGVVLWVAGNQFFAMDRVVGAFQIAHPAVSVGLVTLPPGLELEAIRGRGWSYRGTAYPGRPDVFGSVSRDHLRQTGRIVSYVTYMHNALELMVAAGNPKHVADLHDLGRPDLRVILPNPVDEGIMAIYGKPILTRMGLWNALSPGADCMNCDPKPNVHFTAVHHREIPAAIAAGTADVGLVWRTEIVSAAAGGAPVEGVSLPTDQSAANDVGYVAGALEDSPRKPNADAYLQFLISPEAQEAYGAYGFVPATADERVVRPLTAK